MSLIDYTNNGYRVFPLWPIEQDGSCGCGDPRCQQAGKHPRLTNWQQVPHWSDEQLEMMREHQHGDDHFGVVVDGFLVVDIDPRNGGNESYWRLTEALGGEDLAMSASFVVNTGGGGRHLYFGLPADGSAYVQHLDGYSGIDFKTSGFVVGAGSLHSSGGRYEGHGSLGEITQAPAELLAILRKPDTHRAEYRGQSLDVSDQDLAEILSHVDPDCDHETWVRCGMALHHASGGAAFDVWDEWSQRGNKYPGKAALDKRWHSFGKASNPVTIGTLIYHAQQGGYRPPVTIPETDADTRPDNEPFDTSHIDLLRPPGLVGQLTDWINSQCRYPRERLAVIAALTVIGNIAGLRYVDDKDGATLNLLSLCVAGSATGKEAVLQAVASLHEAVGVQRAMAGSIKSEQEIIRNLVRHQAAYYVVDEVGYLLQKIESARQKGGAAYLDGIISTIMAVYSKADGSFLVTGDLKEEVRKELAKELSNCEAKIAENEDPDGYYQARADDIRNRALPEIDTGIQAPFLSLMGMTTPVSFDGLMTLEQATNGFLGRCILIREHETNPRRKRGFKRPPRMPPDHLKMALCRLYDGGTYDMSGTRERVMAQTEPVEVQTEPETLEMLEDAADWLEDYAESHKGKTGLEAIVRRSYEHLTKVSAILGVGEGVRTVEHVRWAFRLVREDLENKISLAHANQTEGSDEALRIRVLDSLSEDGEKAGAIRNRVAKVKAYTPEDADRMLAILVERGEVVKEQRQHSGNGKMYEVYMRA